MTVIDRSVDGEPEVAFRSTDGTKLEERREVRSGCGGSCKLRAMRSGGRSGQGRNPAAPKRSLASLLPLSLKQAFTRAFLTDQSEVQWEAEGHQFAARVCRLRLRLRRMESAASEASQQPPTAASSRQGQQPVRAGSRS